MGTTLTGTTPQDTYDSLIKVTDNGPIGTSLKTLTDGLGNDSALALSSRGVKVNTSATLITDTASLCHFSNNFLYVRGGSAGLSIGDDAFSNSITLSDNADIAFEAGSAERMRITSAGNVGIGTSSPTAGYKLDLRGRAITYNSGYLADFVSTESNASSIQLYADNGNVSIVQGGTSAVPLNFFVGGSERARITSAGNLLVGTTSESDDVDGIRIEGSNRTILSYTSASAGAGAASHLRRDTDGNSIQFVYGGWSSFVGSISVNSTSTAYNTSSDYRLKENVVEIEDALERIDALKPCRFNFISTPNKTVDGFLAHEVQDVVPESVTGEKDATQMVSVEVSPAVYETIVHPAEEAVLDEEGNEITPAKEEWTEQVLVSEAVYEQQEVPLYQAIDQSKIVPLLVAGLKEAHATIKSLQSRIEALEA